MLRRATVGCCVALAAVSLTPAAAQAVSPPVTYGNAECRAIRKADYAMFSRAGDRAIGLVVASVAPACRGGRRLPPAVARTLVQRRLEAVAVHHEEIYDTAVREATADALERSGALPAIESLDEILP